MAQVFGIAMPRLTAGRSPSGSSHCERFRDDLVEAGAAHGDMALLTAT